MPMVVSTDNESAGGVETTVVADMYDDDDDDDDDDDLHLDHDVGDNREGFNMLTVATTRMLLRVMTVMTPMIAMTT